MNKIREGYHTFRETILPKQLGFYEELAKKAQRPKALMITCSDSRIDPSIFTQTEPGDIFFIRNAGNIIPPHGATNGGEASSIEYAVTVLKINAIILCGHSHCGAMNALLDFNNNPEQRHKFPAVSNWFDHAEATRLIMHERYPHLQGNELLNTAVEENVLIQLNNLSTHPVVSAGLAQGTLNLFGWRYEIETGTIYEYDQEGGEFKPMSKESRPAVPLAIRNGVKPRNLEKI